MQGVHSVAPTFPCDVPATQAMHAVAPDDALYEPTAHSVHPRSEVTVAATVAYRPGSHTVDSVQFAAFVPVLYDVPATHPLHVRSELDELNVITYVPALQLRRGVHTRSDVAVATTLVYVPLLHCVVCATHDDALKPLENVPLGHTLQLT